MILAEVPIELVGEHSEVLVAIINKTSMLIFILESFFFNF